MPRKTCIRCRRNKPISDFYKHSETADGHLTVCKSCVKKRVKKRYYDKFLEIQKYERRRFKNPKRKLKLHLYQVNRRKKFPGKYRARYAVSNAIRDGRLIKLPCSVCGNPKSEAHHADYRSPLKVEWFCRKHHRMRDAGLI